LKLALKKKGTTSEKQEKKIQDKRMKTRKKDCTFTCCLYLLARSKRIRAPTAMKSLYNKYKNG